MPTIDRYNPGSFCWFELATTDQAAAKKFYMSLFGWSVDDSPMGPGNYYSMFKLQDQNTAAAYTMQPEQRSQGIPPHWMVYIAVESADDSARRAQELGAKISAPPFDVFEYGRMAVIADPAGAMFSIWEAKKHHGSSITGVDGTVCWADLSTPDAAAASRFYSSLFGWQLTMGEHDPSGYLHIKNGADFIGGIPASAHRDPQEPPHWLIYFLASDCTAAAAKAKELGAQLLLEPMDMPNVGRMAVVKDPQGAVFALFQPQAK